MAKYKYTAIDPTGASVKGVEEAVTLGQARAMLRGRGFEPVDVTEKRRLLQFEITKTKVPRKEVMHFSRQMAVFVRAGIPLIDGLEVIAEDTTDKTFRKVLAEMVERLRAGSTFADAAEEHPYAFPTYYLGILRSAELTGNLDVVLDQLATYIDRDLEARNKIVSALIYPAVVVAMAIVAVVVLVTYVLPKFQTFFDSLDANLPLPTRMLIGFAEFIGNWWWLILGVPFVAIVSVIIAVRSDKGRYWRDRILLRLPVLGDIVRFAVLERFCRILSSMVSAGVALPDALAVTSEATNNKVYQQGLASAREAMLHGEGLAGPLATTNLFPGAARQMFHVGENAGTLDDQLEAAATYFDRELDYKLKRFTGLFEPAIIVMVGLVVGFVAVALVSAMYGVFNQVKV